MNTKGMSPIFSSFLFRGRPRRRIVDRRPVRPTAGLDQLGRRMSRPIPPSVPRARRATEPRPRYCETVPFLVRSSRSTQSFRSERRQPIEQKYSSNWPPTTSLASGTSAYWPRGEADSRGACAGCHTTERKASMLSDGPPSPSWSISIAPPTIAAKLPAPQHRLARTRCRSRFLLLTADRRQQETPSLRSRDKEVGGSDAQVTNHGHPGEVVRFAGVPRVVTVQTARLV